MSLEPALVGAMEALHRCLALLGRIESSENGAEESARALPHLRHCVEHYDCLLEGLPRGRVDYSARRRDQALEKDPLRLRQHVLGLIERLPGKCRRVGERSLVVCDVVAAGRSADLMSGLGRELSYLSSHCIHHLALLEQGLPDQAGESALGLAFSTEAALEAERVADR